MKKNIALALLLFIIVSTFVLNFGQVSKSITVGGSVAPNFDDDDEPIESHAIHTKWTS